MNTADSERLSAGSSGESEQNWSNIYGVKIAYFADSIAAVARHCSKPSMHQVFGLRF